MNCFRVKAITLAYLFLRILWTSLLYLNLNETYSVWCFYWKFSTPSVLFLRSPSLIISIFLKVTSQKKIQMAMQHEIEDTSHNWSVLGKWGDSIFPFWQSKTLKYLPQKMILKWCNKKEDGQVNIVNLSSINYLGYKYVYTCYNKSKHVSLPNKNRADAETFSL